MKNSFNSIDELKQELVNDKSYNHRFPVRFILIEGLENWNKIITILTDIVDNTLKLSKFCSNHDVIPNLNDLMVEVKKFQDKDILITPLAEYVRLFPDRSNILRELATFEKSDGLNYGTKSRIYVPLFEIVDVFFDQMKNVSRFDDSNECAKYYCLNQVGNTDKVILEVAPENVDVSLMGDDVIIGLKDFMQVWEKKPRINTVLSSRFAKYFKRTSGNYSINVYNNTFELLVNYANGCGNLNQKWGSDEQWSWLLSQIKKEEHLKNFFLRTFNLGSFDVKSLFARWQDFDSNKQWLAWLWCKIEEHHGYLQFLMKDSNGFDTFEEDIINGVFLIDDQKLGLDILIERKELLGYLGIQSLPELFWEIFSNLTNSVQKLKCLAGITNEEKCKAIEVVKDLLEKKVEEEKWYDILSVNFPDLAYYLSASDYGNQEVYEYFYNYLRLKLTDKVNDKMQELVKVVSNNHMWDYNARNYIIQSKGKKGIFYWVDGMGVEWLGLIEGILRNEFENIEYEYEIARAKLPTITECNKDWEGTENYNEYKGYDQLVHSYTCKYPDYIVEEFSHIREIVKNAVNLLKTNDSVIITADHGTSRLAGINKQQSTSIPEQIEVKKFGRYCINDGSLDVNDYKECIEEDGKLIFATYGRFSVGGHVPGEIHGGATLEEVLVPVITIKKKSQEAVVISFEPKSTSIKMNAKNEAVLNVKLTAAAEKLILLLGGSRFEAKLKDDKWQILLKGLQPGKYKGTLWADNSNIGDIEFKLTKGLSINDMGL